MLLGLEGFNGSLWVAQEEKSMSLQIRLANPEDAGAIATIAAEAQVASIDPGSPRVHRLLGEGRTFVATVGEEIVGFADTFFTSDPAGGRRFELDLLAVDSQARGRGAGGRLLAKGLEVARTSAARHIRTLVRCGNLPMGRLCHRHGFARSPLSYELYVADPQPASCQQRYHSAHLATVETLSYAGIWLEGALSQEAIEEAHRIAIQGDMSVIGTVISAEASEATELLRAKGFQKIGAYHWWTINQEND